MLPPVVPLKKTILNYRREVRIQAAHFVPGSTLLLMGMRVEELDPSNITFNCALFQAKPLACHTWQQAFLARQYNLLQLCPHLSYDDTLTASPALVTTRLDYGNTL